MVTFLLLRHGNSVNNAEKRFSGQYDTPLSDEGKKQARLAAEYIRKAYSVDVVYSSDLSRAMDTAVPTAEAFGLEIRPRKEFRELDVGVFQNRSFEEVWARYPEEYDAYRNRNGRCPGGECFGDMARRAQTALAELAREHDGQTVLIATHGGLIRTLLCLWDGFDLLEMKNRPALKNASLTVVEYDAGAVRILERDRCDYLSISGNGAENTLV